VSACTTSQANRPLAWEARNCRQFGDAWRGAGPSPEHFNAARPHRGIGQLSPAQAETGPPTPIDLTNQRVHRSAILGGLINEYQIAS
jgi:hypothetical protein